MQVIHVGKALLADGWARDVRLEIGADGRIASVARGCCRGAMRGAVLLPAPGNLHSHIFQRAMAGLSEARTPGRTEDSFWTWQRVMYRFLGLVGPEDVEAIAAQVMVESAEAGFASAGGVSLPAPYAGRHALMPCPPRCRRGSRRRRMLTGFGLTLLPVLYMQGGCGRAGAAGRAAEVREPSGRVPGDRRGRAGGAGGDAGGCRSGGCAAFACARCRRAKWCGLAALVPEGPVHIHAAEQVREVEELVGDPWRAPGGDAAGSRCADARWCLIHATQMTPEPRPGGWRGPGPWRGSARSPRAIWATGSSTGRATGPLAGLFGVGSDSNLRIDLAEELRVLEHSQRLRDRARAVLAEDGRSTGRVLWEESARGAAQALGRGSGAVSEGQWADAVILDVTQASVAGLSGDMLLDAHVFAGPAPVRDLWSAGRHIVREGRHVARDAVAARFADVVTRLRAAI